VKNQKREVDPITLAVVRGALETTQRQMTLTMERTGRSSVLTVSRDFSNAIFDWSPEMIVQGQDLPIHLGSLILATKAVASYFDGDIHPGDVFIHNDPVYDGSHILDWCQYKPVFFEDEIVFWLVSKGHMADGGGPVPGSYNPMAEDIYAEGLRIPPVKLYDKGEFRADLFNLLVTNVRTQENIAGDLRAQLGALRVGERNLVALLEKYGKTQVKECVSELLNLSEMHMRKLIADLPDGISSGSAMVEDIGHGLGDQRIDVQIEVREDRLKITLEAPPQLPYYTNSYRANTTSAIYLGVVMFMKPDPPYNEGMYRPVEIDYGSLGTMVNAIEPAAHVASTTCPAETITDAVRDTLTEAYPSKAAAGWGHCSCINVSGIDPASGKEYVHMMVSTLACGAGALGGVMDGWHCIGPQAGLGGATCGEQELLEAHYPLIVHDYSITEDSGGPGEWRGGCGVTCEIEPVGHTMTVVVWGEGRKYPASSALGAAPSRIEIKLGSVEVIRRDGSVEQVEGNTMLKLEPGERIRTCSAGGGAVGPSWQRSQDLVLEDVLDRKVSISGALAEYGVVIKPDIMEVDEAATKQIRAEMAEKVGPHGV
jgi:N-methylhydantoinase B